jgi:type IV pilus assembly protein PilY1
MIRKSNIFLVLLLISFLCHGLASLSFANDTDLYMASGEGVEPNILIMFDNSGSMNDEVQAYYYDPAVLYSPLVVPQANKNTVYYKTTSGSWNLFANSISDVACLAARTALTNSGNYAGYTNSTCRSSQKTLRTGNYQNYLTSIGGDEYIPKLSIAKKVISDFLNTINNVRVGVMIFNTDEGGRIKSDVKSLTDTNRTQLINDIHAVVAGTWTPLAETLYEAGLYFKGGASKFNNGVVHISPIQYSCQRNYVLIITDGESTMDQNSILAQVIGDRDGDGREPGGKNAVYYASYGTDYLDDVAKYLYETDLSSSYEGQQNIITYTIGFTIHSDLLERAAANGHGRYFYANSAQQLADAFQNVIDEILSKSTSFVAPIVPVSRMERTTAGDKIYLALFKPLRSQMWSGNIKKYGVAQTDSGGVHAGDITDTKGLQAVDSRGQFLATATSYWSTGMDGGDVEKGGVGEALLKRSTARNLYTYFGTKADLTDSTNAFKTGNNLITPTTFGLDSADSSGRDKLIQFVQGYDAYDENGNGVTTEKRDWILGAFVHSRPYLVHYASRDVIFAGSNDGMLHAFDDSTGDELWGFIPPNLLNQLQALHADVNLSFVDGSPKAYISYDSNGQITQVILIFGERRGGNRYYALDVTDPLKPKYLWDIGPDTKVADKFPYAEMGQSWSSPIIGKIAYGSGEKWVAFIGGGYDDNQDNNPVALADSKGRAIYVVDIFNGSLVWRFSFAEDSKMTYSIPSDIARVDVEGDGRVDRLYAGDMGGRMWRFDVGDKDPSKWTGKIIFKSNPEGTTNPRKMFYPPDVTLESDNGDYEMLFFGTGDREHPKTTGIIDRLYAVKDRNLTDKNPAVAYSESDLVNVTDDLLQNSSKSIAEKNALLVQLKEKGGWYITLDSNSGEKALSAPVVFYKTVYFTTFSPTAGVDTDPCFVGEGTAMAYALNYMNGTAMFNLDLTNDVGGKEVISKSDRFSIIGTAIPSGVIVTVVGGKAVSYVGVGGGVCSPRLANTSSLVPLNWRIVF